MERIKQHYKLTQLKLGFKYPGVLPIHEPMLLCFSITRKDAIWSSLKIIDFLSIIIIIFKINLPVLKKFPGNLHTRLFFPARRESPSFKWEKANITSPRSL